MFHLIDTRWRCEQGQQVLHVADAIGREVRRLEGGYSEALDRKLRIVKRVVERAGWIRWVADVEDAGISIRRDCFDASKDRLRYAACFVNHDQNVVGVVAEEILWVFRGESNRIPVFGYIQASLAHFVVRQL